MTKVDELIAQGATQRSRKYRRVFLAPTVYGSCLLWLKENRPEIYDNIVEEALHSAESTAKCILWQQGDKHDVELTEEEFDEFREKTTGKVPWTKEGKQPCPDCKSLGHMHRRNCKYYK